MPSNHLIAPDPRLAALEQQLALVLSQLAATEQWCRELAGRVQALECAVRKLSWGRSDIPSLVPPAAQNCPKDCCRETFHFCMDAGTHCGKHCVCPCHLCEQERKQPPAGAHLARVR